MISICDKCIYKDNKEICAECRDNPEVQIILASLPKKSIFMPYVPTCPRGYIDCIYDPAYIKHYDPDWYKELYGHKTPEEAAEECRQRVARDPNEEYYCYDDEDK